MSVFANTVCTNIELQPSEDKGHLRLVLMVFMHDSSFIAIWLIREVHSIVAWVVSVLSTLGVFNLKINPHRVIKVIM